MRVAILHYHLRPGGVTKVIQHTLTALLHTDVQAVVIAGEPSSPAMLIPDEVVIESLGYHDLARPSQSLDRIVKELETTAKQELGGMPDLWHIHNHALGKNLVLPEVTYLLAQRGQPLLLQIHDFAEDGRPDNYQFLRNHICPSKPHELGNHLYPQGTYIHYALINQRDLNFLKTAGVESEQLHYLPNAVSPEENLNTAKALEQTPLISLNGQRLFFYPARAIRRKNIGEFLLWSLLGQKDDVFAIARSPQNPLARPVYNAWVEFAQAHRLPVQFGFGESWQGDFFALLQSAHALVTTSVAEGFGLAFLEPWLVGRPLVGRNLSEITRAIESTGVDLSSLYQRLDAPIRWIGRAQFQKELQRHLHQVYESYGRTAQQDDLDLAITEAIKEDRVDFGKLNEHFQETVLKQLLRSPSARDEIYPPLLEPFDNQSDIIQRNQKVIMEQFNLKKYGERLLQLYQTVATSEAGQLDQLNAGRLLDQFLAPERFCLLRT